MLRTYSIRKETGMGLVCNSEGYGDYVFKNCTGKLVMNAVYASKLVGKDTKFGFVTSFGERMQYPSLLSTSFFDYPRRRNEMKEDLIGEEFKTQFINAGNFTVMIENADSGMIIDDIVSVFEEDNVNIQILLDEINKGIQELLKRDFK
ncbi:MAG: hypothetical protein ABID54_07345 [Pseudomonadota bacterium]